MRRQRDRAARAAAVACALLLLVAGCDSSDDDSAGEPVEEGGPWAALGENVWLTPDSATEAARRYVLRAVLGASPFAIAQQSPSVTDAVGLRRMARALEGVPATSFGARARARLTGREGDLARVEVRLIGSSLRKKRYAFVLVNRDGRWRVAYDALTRQALAGTTRRRVVRRYLAAGRRVAEAG